MTFINRELVHLHVAGLGRAELGGHRENGRHAECDATRHRVFVYPEAQPGQTHDQH